MDSAARTETVAARMSPVERVLVEAAATSRGESLSSLMREGAIALALREIDLYREQVIDADAELLR